MRSDKTHTGFEAPGASSEAAPVVTNTTVTNTESLVTTSLVQPTRSNGPASDDDDPTPTDVLKSWRQGKKPTTLDTYQYATEYFLDYLHTKHGWRYPDDYDPRRDAGQLALTDLMRGHGRTNARVIGYMHWLQHERAHPDGSPRTVRDATVSIYVAALRSLVHAANLLGLISWRIDARSPKVTKYRDTAGPPSATIASLLDYYEQALAALPPNVISRRRLRLLRDRAILRLMVNGGVRRGEIVSLDVKHIDFKTTPTDSKITGGVWLLGKGRRERSLHQPGDRAMAAIHDWLTAAEATSVVFKLGDRGPKTAAFVALDNAHLGDRLDPGGVYFVTDGLKAVADERGTGAPLRPHGFRHWAVTQVASRRGIQEAAAFARHTNTAVTLRYIDNLNVRAAEGAQAVEAATDEAVALFLLTRKQNSP